MEKGKGKESLLVSDKNLGVFVAFRNSPQRSNVHILSSCDTQEAGHQTRKGGTRRRHHGALPWYSKSTYCIVGWFGP